jgi:hypothetical protein
MLSIVRVPLLPAGDGGVPGTDASPFDRFAVRPFVNSWPGEVWLPA